MITRQQATAMKSALTRAQRSGDSARILKVCDAAFETFERDGYPDAWHRWNIAREDARYAMARERAGL
jgi:hypothetical protein